LAVRTHGKDIRSNSLRPVFHTSHIRHHLRTQRTQRCNTHHGTDDKPGRYLRHDLEDDNGRQQAKGYDDDWRLESTACAEISARLGRNGRLWRDGDEVAFSLEEGGLLLDDGCVLGNPGTVGVDVGMRGRREVLGQLGIGRESTVWQL